MTTLQRCLLPLFAALAALGLTACSSTEGIANARIARKGDVIKVRTTAYTHSEPDHRRYGAKNAVGTTLKASGVRSAAADWSRIPYGTKFKIIQTGETYMVDDYGSALVGTNTIDLYKPSYRAMNDWGVKHVDIKILSIGCYQQSAAILQPRRKHSHVDKMARVMENRKTPSKKAPAPTNRKSPAKPSAPAGPAPVNAPASPDATSASGHLADASTRETPRGHLVKM